MASKKSLSVLLCMPREVPNVSPSFQFCHNCATTSVRMICRRQAAWRATCITFEIRPVSDMRSGFHPSIRLSGVQASRWAGRLMCAQLQHAWHVLRVLCSVGRCVTTGLERADVLRCLLQGACCVALDDACRQTWNVLTCRGACCRACATATSSSRTCCWTAAPMSWSRSAILAVPRCEPVAGTGVAAFHMDGTHARVLLHYSPAVPVGVLKISSSSCQHRTALTNGATTDVPLSS
jgi:hypothetical protein